jgi:hypothetical protein
MFDMARAKVNAWFAGANLFVRRMDAQRPFCLKRTGVSVKTQVLQ